MIDLHDELKRGRVLKAIKTSETALLPFRKVRKELVQDYVGDLYSTNGAKAKTLVNLLNQTAKVYTVALAANNPKVLIKTPRVENLPFARRFEVNLNKLISDMELDVTFRAIVLDAFFCIGCGVVMMRDTDTRYHGLLESEEDVWLDPGEPWINRVSLDDLILDMSAKELSKMRFCGHRYRADFEKVKSEPGYDKKVQAELAPSKKASIDNPDSVRNIASDTDDDELKPMIWLQDLWIPENNSVSTMVIGQNLPPLIEREWTGSQAGPYKFLSLGNVPDNVVPVSPALNLKWMHDLQNRLHCRMEVDSDDSRKVNAYAPGASDDAETLRKAGRNDWVKVQNPNDINQLEFGGIDQRDQAFSLQIQDSYDRFAGNLQAMGGLGAQAATLGQEEMIHGQVSRMEADMRMAVEKFAAASILDLGRLMWEDQNMTLQTSMPVGNTGIEVRSDWTPDDRDGDFEDYDFEVVRYSTVFKTPETLLQETFQMLDRLAPFMPMIQAVGGSIDMQAVVDDIARLKDRPEFKKYIVFTAPLEMAGGDPHGATQSPVTSRETIRRSVPTGGTAANRSHVMQQELMGGGQNNSQQKASLGRPPA